jgi:hypothetical protein
LRATQALNFSKTGLGQLMDAAFLAGNALGISFYLDSLPLPSFGFS